MDFNTFVRKTANVWIEKFGKQIELDEKWTGAVFKDFRGSVLESSQKDQHSYFHQLVQEEIDKIDSFSYSENEHIIIRVKLKESSSTVQFFNKEAREQGWMPTPYKRFNFRGEHEALRAVWEWFLIVREWCLAEEMQHSQSCQKAMGAPDLLIPAVPNG